MPDHYAVLGVPRSASDADIKKAYRKEALKWHPDKNADRKELAERKFKDISAAFKVLSDPDERAHYDRYGEERQAGGGGGGPRAGPRGPHGGMYAEELTPEDIFNMFFGMPPRGHPHGGHPHAGARRAAGGPRPMQADVNVNLIQLAPFLLLMLFSVLSSLPIGGETTPYSLQPSDGYMLERSTEALGVRYFVADSFELRHTDAATLRKVEDRVESDALGRVRRRCKAERESKQKMVDAANGHQGAERSRMLEAVDRVEMPWCEEKDALEAAKAR